MTSKTEPARPAAPPPGTAEPLHATPRQLEWLRTQVADWQRAGLLDAPTATAIVGRYRASRGVTLGRTLLAVGGTFVGIGLVWLVAANLDQISPGVRFGLLLAIWVAVLVASEWLEARRASAALVGSLRTVVALGAGAVVFQAAQSLQVPAWEPRLIGCWSVVALALAYLRTARGPLLVGLATGTGWVLWQGLGEDPEFLTAIVLGGAVTVGAVGLSSLHERGRPTFAGPWLHVGAAAALATLFAAAVPVESDDVGGVTVFAWVALAVGLVGAATPWLVRADRAARWQSLVAVGVVAVAVGLARWGSTQDVDAVGANDVLHALVAVALYVGLAVGVGALGALRDSWLLGVLSTGALVVFTVFQSFAVFAPIVQGAWLFLLLGVVLLGTGVGFDRLRRTVAASIDETDPSTGPEA